jgi:hypothetical protein
MRESRTYGSVRGAQDETCVPTATEGAVLTGAKQDRVGVKSASRAEPEGLQWGAPGDRQRVDGASPLR